ncbi:2681_t:CDS:2 [Ambispora gerdemannii]|uniref:2681_t:CDS:1 n=1 Tax=Ambispora gerdemannii TaxID=144530 RepID=A0A9N8ZZW6_9GLOM|nr:2681_t:CDS:2 [Ambispora gerdemannii]
MANKQSKVDSLEERISKLVAENDILRRENTEIKSEKLISDLMVSAEKQRLALISQNSDELA